MYSETLKQLKRSRNIMRQLGNKQVNLSVSNQALAGGGLFSIMPISFNTDDMINPVFQIAFPLFVAFFPIIGIIGGLALGFNLVNKITKMFQHLGS